MLLLGALQYVGTMEAEILQLAPTEPWKQYDLRAYDLLHALYRDGKYNSVLICLFCFINTSLKKKSSLFYSR